MRNFFMNGAKALLTAVMTAALVFSAFPAGAVDSRTVAFAAESNKTAIQKPANVLTSISGDCYISYGANENYVIDVQYASTENGAGVILQEKSGAANQIFRFERQPDDSYKIIPLHSGKPLEISNNDVTHNAKLQQYQDADGYDCKLFWIIDCGDGRVNIVSKYSGMFLDLDNGVIGNGTLVHVWDRTNGATQKWTITKASESSSANPNKTTVPKPANVLTSISGDCYINYGANENFVMDVQFASKDNGAGVILQEKSGNSNQIFRFEKQPDDSYKITPLHSGKPLEIGGNDKTHNAKLQQYQDADGYDCKLFWIVDCGGGRVNIINKFSGLYIDLDNGITKSGTLVHVWERTGGDTQKWTITKAAEVKGTTTMTDALYGLSGGASKISCGFDGYKAQSGRHEGIDFCYKLSANVYALTDGEVTYVAKGAVGGDGLSTIAIYNATSNKTVIYLHTAPESLLYVGQKITRGQKIAVESWRGVSSSDKAHTHVEVRDGRQTHASKSVGDPVLDNNNPTAFWNSQGYEVK